MLTVKWVRTCSKKPQDSWGTFKGIEHHSDTAILSDMRDRFDTYVDI